MLIVGSAAGVTGIVTDSVTLLLSQPVGAVHVIVTLPPH